MCSNTGGVRLVASDNNMTEGRLEVCVNDHWGTVCNDGLNNVFDRNAAEVVCKQLGFPESGEPYSLIPNLFQERTLN
jgi:deleted-in-malignant-brain-tumors protein 1